MNRSLNNPRREGAIEKGFTRKQLWHEMMIAARFGVVGMVLLLGGGGFLGSDVPRVDW